ncbi:MAG: transporter substrate-binding domain-containing protein [Clostridia bacterium]|nr:transporter substrate-binding domain-containing protein [Clostridia bacterium]
MNMKKVIALAAAAMLAVGTLAGCGGATGGQSAADTKTVASVDDLKGAKIAVQEGTTGDVYVTDEVEGAQVSRFKRAVDAAIDLKNGKVDAVVIDDQVAKDLIAEVEGLKILPDVLTEEQYAIAMPKGETELVKTVDAVIADATASGLIDTIRKAYIDKDEAALAELAALQAPAGDMKLVMGTNAEFAPFEYQDDNGEIVGYDIEIAKEIARQMGCELVIENMPFDSLIAALNSGKIDLIIAGMTANDERRQQVEFSENYYNAAQVIIVKE